MYLSLDFGKSILAGVCRLSRYTCSCPSFLLQNREIGPSVYQDANGISNPVKQELAKEGVLPFSKFFASDWPIKTPTGGLLLHWSFTVVLITGPRTSDAYAFISFLYAYTQIWIQRKDPL